MNVFGWFIATILAAIGGILSCGFVGSKLWLWFVVPIGENIAVLNIWQILGLMLFVQFLTIKFQSCTKTFKDKNDAFMSYVSLYCVSPWILLGVGYFYHYMSI